MGDVRQLKKFTRGQIDAALMKIGDQVGMETEAGLKAFLKGDLVVQWLDHRVHVDRASVPDYSGVHFDRLDVPYLEFHGPSEYDLEPWDFWDYFRTGKTLQSIYDSLKAYGGLEDCFNLQDAFAMIERPLLFRRVVRGGRIVYFLGSVVVSKDRGALMVPCLEYAAEKVWLHWHYLEELGMGTGKQLVARRNIKKV